MIFFFTMLQCKHATSIPKPKLSNNAVLQQDLWCEHHVTSKMKHFPPSQTLIFKAPLSCMKNLTFLSFCVTPIKTEFSPMENEAIWKFQMFLAALGWKNSQIKECRKVSSENPSFLLSQNPQLNFFWILVATQANWFFWHWKPSLLLHLEEIWPSCG